jgi:uncharacterized protein (DUF2141 family)
MNTRSKHRTRWVVQGVAAALMLAFSAASGQAATLRGTLVDYSGYSQGRYYVYLVRMNLDTPVIGWTSTTTAGAWEIRNVPSGHYFVLAWRDVNGNFVPSRGEPLGYYGVPFPSRVTVQGSNISGLQVVLGANNLGAELRGRVNYAGALTGRIWVIAHATPTLELTSVRGTPWTMNAPGDYQTFVLDHGTYFITAFMDVNGNLLIDDDEPIGKVGPVDIVVTPGVTYTFNILLQDQTVRSTPVTPQTWSGVKSLYRN